MTDYETVDIATLSDREIERYESGAEAEQQMYRTAEARAMLEAMQCVYSRATERFNLDEKLGRQKIFLARLFRPVVICLSSDTRRTVAFDDFIEYDRDQLFHDADRAIAYLSPKTWVWTSETRALSESLSANNRSVSILMIEVMRVLRSELQMLIDNDDWLSTRVRTITDNELAEAVEHYQRHDHAYCLSIYPQKTVEQEAEEAEEAMEIFIVYQRRLLMADMRAYPDAVARRGYRSKKAEDEISECIRNCGPDLMSRWKNTLAGLEEAEDKAGEGGE